MEYNETLRPFVDKKIKPTLGIRTDRLLKEGDRWSMTDLEGKMKHLTDCIIRGRRQDEIPSIMKMSDGAYTTDVPSTIKYILNELIPNSNLDPAFEPMLEWIPGERISPNELRRVAWNQKFKAPGFDRISARIIRAVWPWVEAPLLAIINESLTRCVFP